MFQHKVLPALLIASALVPVIYIVAPLVHMFGGLTWSDLSNALLNPEVDSAIGTSVAAALASTAAALLFGLPTAFLLAAKQFWGKRLIESLLVLPLVLPPVVSGIGQLFLYGPMTPVGNWFSGHHMPLTNSLAGVVLAQVYITSPFLILAAKAGFEEIPGELKEATQTLGGSLWHNFWYVSLPLARSAIYSGLLLTFARSIGEFGATMIMAYHPYSLPVEIWVQFSSGGLDMIEPIAAVVTLFALLVALASSVRPQHKRGVA